MLVVADDKIPFLRGVLEPFCEVRYISGAEIKNSDVLSADAMIIRTRTLCNATLLEGSKVKFIATATIGYDHIDLTYCNSKNITVTTAAGCNAAAVAQYVMAAIMRFFDSTNGLTIGIVGCGNVGTQVEAAAQRAGLSTLRHDPPRQSRGDKGFVSMQNLIKNSDIITIHTPLTLSGDCPTNNFFSKEEFAMMKHDALFINSSRGEVLDEEALIETIKTGKLRGAVIDVWRNEPNISKELLSLADITTPHIAGYSLQGKANGTAISIGSLSTFFGIDALKGWYPDGVTQPDRSKLTSWSALKADIESKYNILDDSKALKNAADSFESLRNNYNYRSE